MVKLFFDGLEVIKNIGVIKLQIVQQRRAWPVMYKLAALVKKCRVVFVGFNDKVIAWMTRCNIAQSGGDAKVQRNAANQETWFEAGSF